MQRHLAWLRTERGILASVWSERGLYELTFPYPSEAEARKHLAAPVLPEPELTPLQEQWRQTLELEMQAYFDGRPVRFTVPVDWSDYTDFRLQALQFAARIPPGQVATYGGVAAAIGRPGAARAVGGAMHANRTPLVVPCHRVVGSDGSLTGFGGGLALKQELLELEKKR